MKKSILKVLVFSSIIIVVAFVLNNFLDRQMRKLKYEDASVWNQIASGKINAQLLIMGSSRAATHIDPRLLAKASGYTTYNLGMMGHNFFIEDARYRFYLTHNRKPQIIILSLDYESLQKRHDLFNHTQFIGYLGDTIIANACKQYEGFAKYDYKLPLLKYVGEQTLIFSLFKNALNPSRNKPDRNYGFFARDMHWDAHVDHVLDTLAPYTVVPDSLSVSVFNDFLDHCKSQHIRLVLVHTPNHPLGQAKVKNRAEIIDYYQKIADQHQLLFLDYSEDTMCANKKYFMNATHLNTLGASIFTNKLIRDLQSHHQF